VSPRTRIIIFLVILWFRKKPVPIEQSKKFIYKAKMYENQRPRKKIINKLHQKKIRVQYYPRPIWFYPVMYCNITLQ